MYISSSCIRQRKATGNSIHRLYQLLLCISKTETKTLEHKHLTLAHTTTVTSEDSRKSQLLFGLHITEMKESRKKHSLRAAVYNSNHWFFVFFVIFDQWKHSIIQKFHRCDWSKSIHGSQKSWKQTGEAKIKSRKSKAKMDDGYFPDDKIVSPITLILGLNLVTSELSALKFPQNNKCHCIFNHHVLQIKVLHNAWLYFGCLETLPAVPSRGGIGS